MITISSDTDYQPDESLERLLQRIAQTLTDREIELTFADNATIRAMNRAHRGVDAPTDVLSFPLESVPFAPLGTIVIGVDFATDRARHYGHSREEEVALLFIHGLLHLLGYDHETDDGRMRRKEEELIRRFDLPESLIVRTEEER